MMKKITLLIILLLAFSFGYGQEVASFSSVANSGCSGIIANDSNITTTGICRGSGIIENAGATYNSRNWTTAANIDANDYLEWTLTPNIGFSIDLANMDITYDRSGQGPTEVDIQVDTGSGFISIFTDASVSEDTEDNNGIDLSSITGITGTITFRLFAFNAGSAAGTFDIDENIATNKGIIINGIINTLPCPGGITTWNGTAWNNGIPDVTTEAVIDGNYTANAANSFSACSLLINAGNTLNVSDGFIEVENDVVVNGNLTVQTQGNFVQRDNTGVFTLNPGGTARVNKTTSPKADWFYYTYWSSPVEDETIEEAFPDTPADRRFWFDASAFVDNAPTDDIDDDANDWQFALAGDTMTPGVGYAATESRFHTPGGAGTADFEGVFNTGDIPVTIALDPTNLGVNWNFIGNPYPSALDFDAFQAANSTIIDGSAYFWSQASPPLESNLGNEGLNFNLNDYAIYTVGSGGTAGGVSGKEPNGFVASCQGFFVPALSAGTATFTNAMRMADDTSNDQFFKNSRTKKSNTESLKNKLWLNLTSDNGVFNQVLIAYVDGATDSNDGMYYDAPKFLSQDYAAALYSLSDSDNIKYAIQGKNTTSIDESEIIKLGLSTNIDVATIYTLSIAQLEGEFLQNNTVSLKDNLTNTIHNLSDSDYSFTSEVGEFNNRFEVAFSATALSTNDFNVNANTVKIVQLNTDTVEFTTETSNFKTITVIDLLGRTLKRLNADSNTETYNLNALKTAVYIANIELENGVTLSKKFVKK